MSLAQFVLLSLFVIACIFVTYTNSVKIVQIRKQRDNLLLALDDLNRAINIEGIKEPSQKLIAAGLKAKKALKQALKIR